MIIDSHAYVLPDPYGILSYSEPVRARLKGLAAPAVRTIHRAQEWMRVIPEPIRRGLDPIGALMAVPALAIESTLGDLQRMLDAEDVRNVLISAHDGLASNKFVLECASRDPRIWPAVHLGPEFAEAPSQLKDFKAWGAKALKLHPAASGRGPGDPGYAPILAMAAEVSLPVFLHTGSMHWPFFKDPGLGKAEVYRDWFREHPSVDFVLAHMNYQEPSVAIDLAEEFPNVWLETSWQPMEIVAEAVRRIGSERIVFGSGWPFVGENVPVGVRRIRECVEAGMMKGEDADRILGANALRLLDPSGENQCL